VTNGELIEAFHGHSGLGIKGPRHSGLLMGLSTSKSMGRESPILLSPSSPKAERSRVGRTVMQSLSDLWLML